MAINPSLLIVPYRYKAAKLYSQLPESGDGDFTVVRGTTATRVNASGLIESVASGVPRLDYSGGGCPSLLVEPAATNSIRNNTMVGAVAGTPGTLPTNFGEVTAGLTRQVVGIGIESGVEYFDLKLSGTATSAAHALRFEAATQIAASNGQAWSNSVYLKLISGTPNSVQLSSIIYAAGPSFLTSSSLIVTANDVLQRYSQSFTIAAPTAESVQPSVIFNLTIGQSYDFTIRIGLPQMELGAVPTSVIKTSTVAVTRNADVISLSSASGLIGQTEGTLYAEVDLRNFVTSTARIFGVSDGTSTNRIIIVTNSANRITLIITNGGAESAQISTPTLSVGVYKIAVAYAVNDFVLYVNGTQIGADTSGAVPSCSAVFLGKTETTSSSGFINDRISAAAIYTSRLSNSELQALTTL